ncbi:hypothetical protein QYF36_013518 [Acer negundo]|nr:hypothetical protein QYF36_013518 [Acer negundo]
MDDQHYKTSRDSNSDDSSLISQKSTSTWMDYELEIGVLEFDESSLDYQIRNLSLDVKFYGKQAPTTAPAALTTEQLAPTACITKPPAVAPTTK